VYLHLLGRLEHHEGCTERRCVQKCDVAAFLARLEQPLLLTDIRRVERERERLAALAKGEIPKAV
jgi:hypothetical protein